MTATEKVQAMELLWDALTAAGNGYESPEWHAAVLEERERRIASGEASFMSMEESKRCLAERAYAS
ncbi:MAG: acyl-protein synthetase [Lentisphaerae bacterium]|nr:acyl-protein synthetase [Lentisphaerota bacterium]MBR3821395.1 addiction module protein [Kiritimatiellia bacterium]